MANAGVVASKAVYKSEMSRRYRLSKNRGWTFSRDILYTVMAKTGLPEETVETVMTEIGLAMQARLLDGYATGLPGTPVMYMSRADRSKSKQKGKLKVNTHWRALLRTDRAFREKVMEVEPPYRGSVEDQYAVAQKKALGVKPVKELYESKRKRPFYTRP